MRKTSSKVISFSGPDGSGKTTSFLNVKMRLEASDCRVFQLRNLQYARLKYMYRKASDGALGNVGRLGVSSQPRDRGNGLWYTARRYLGLIAALLDIIIFGRLALRYLKRNYDVILVEEAPYDVYVKRHRPMFDRTLKLSKTLLPRPDLVVLCHANSEVIVGRKPELSESEIQKYYGSMKKIYSDIPDLKLHILDTNEISRSDDNIARLIQEIL